MVNSARWSPIALCIVVALVALHPRSASGEEPPAPAVAEDGGDPGRAFYRAYYLEKGLRDFKAAVDAFDRAATLAQGAADASLHARSLAGKGSCLRALGRDADAEAAAREALVVDPMCLEAKDLLASSTPSETESLVEDHLRKLVDLLAQSGDARVSAEMDLVRAGDRAIPALLAGLSSHKIGLAAHCAQVLVSINTHASGGVLAEALRDPALAYPAVVAAALVDAGSSDFNPVPMEAAFLAAMDRADESRRISLVDRAGSLATSLRMPGTAMFIRATRDPSEAVVKLALSGDWNNLSGDAAAQAVADVLQRNDPQLWEVAMNYLDRSAASIDSVILRDRVWSLANKDGRVALQAASWLGKIGAIEYEVRDAHYARHLASDDLDTVERVMEFVQKAYPKGLPTVLLDAALDAMRKSLSSQRRNEQERLISRIHFFLSNLQSPAEPKPSKAIDLYVTLVENQSIDREQRRDLEDLVLGFLIPAQIDDENRLASIGVEGLQRIANDGTRARWVSAWLERTNCQERVFLEPAAGSASVQVRWAVYEHLNGVSPMKPPLSLPHLSADLALAHSEQSPRSLLGGDRPARGGESFEDAVLRVAARHASEEHVGPIRALLGAGDLDDLGLHFALTALVQVLGDGAREELLAAVSGPAADTALRLLLDVAGEDAIPHLVDRAGDTRKPVSLVADYHAPNVWKCRVSREILHAYLLALPPELCDGPMLQVALVSLKERDLDWFIRGALAGTHGKGTQDLLLLAIGALRERIPESESWDLLLPLLDNGDPSVRTAAANALEEIRSIRALKAQHSGTAAPVTVAPMLHLGHPGDPNAAAHKKAKALAKSKDSMARRRAVLAYAVLGDGESVAALLDLAEDPDANVSTAAVAALERLAQRGPVRSESGTTGEGE